jgi:hypothetical protein
LSHFLKTTHVEYYVKWRSRRSRSRSQTCIALRLLLHQNDAAPCGSGSAKLVKSVGGELVEGGNDHLKKDENKKEKRDEEGKFRKRFEGRVSRNEIN